MAREFMHATCSPHSLPANPSICTGRSLHVHVFTFLHLDSKIKMLKEIFSVEILSLLVIGIGEYMYTGSRFTTSNLIHVLVINSTHCIQTF